MILKCVVVKFRVLKIYCVLYIGKVLQGGWIIKLYFGEDGFGCVCCEEELVIFFYYIDNGRLLIGFQFGNGFIRFVFKNN